MQDAIRGSGGDDVEEFLGDVDDLMDGTAVEVFLDGVAAEGDGLELGFGGVGGDGDAVA